MVSIVETCWEDISPTTKKKSTKSKLIGSCHQARTLCKNYLFMLINLRIKANSTQNIFSGLYIKIVQHVWNETSHYSRRLSYEQDRFAGCLATIIIIRSWPGLPRPQFKTSVKRQLSKLFNTFLLKTLLATKTMFIGDID